MITIYGSHGEIQVNNNGELVAIEYNHDVGEPCHDNCYDKIARFDLEEWKRAYPDDNPEASPIDILDVGFWGTDGNYAPPDEDWRAEFRKQFASRLLDMNDAGKGRHDG